MALNFVQPSPSVLQTYQQSLVDFVGAHPPIARLYHLPVGTLGLAELGNGATFDNVVAAGCRILAYWPDATWTSCEMTNPTLYGNALFRNFTTGAPVEAAFKRIAEALALDAVRSGDYELNFLSIPGIYLEALHLVGRAKGSDIVLPLLSIDPQLGLDSVLDEPAFLAIARPGAATRAGLASSDPLSS
jgi:hypothetical protein